MSEPCNHLYLWDAQIEAYHLAPPSGSPLVCLCGFLFKDFPEHPVWIHGRPPPLCERCWRKHTGESMRRRRKTGR